MIFIDFLKARDKKNKYGMLAQNFNRSTNVAMEHNGWVYEQVCLAECFKLPIKLMANLLIYLVSSSTVINHKCSIGELNLFLFFFERWQK